MSFQIIRDNIINMHADAIVNTANPRVAIGGGVDSAIYAAAGARELLTERSKIGEMKRGEAAITPAFGLHAKYIIHTVGPAWIDGEHGELNQLSSCYGNSLELAKENKCESIAFPLISTGTYGFPKDQALQIAINVISQFLLQNDMKIILAVFDQESFELSGKLFDGIDAYIDDNLAEEHLRAEYSRAYYASESELLPRRTNISRRRDVRREDNECSDIEKLDEQEIIMKAPKASKSASNLDDVVGQLGENFQERLLRLIDERQMTDVQVYKKANLDRKLFSKIRCNHDYKPKKKTAVALAIALELNLDDTKDLLARAELALSPSSKFDLIVEYFIENEVYDIYTINLALFKHEQPLLGD